MSLWDLLSEDLQRVIITLKTREESATLIQRTVRAFRPRGLYTQDFKVGDRVILHYRCYTSRRYHKIGVVDKMSKYFLYSCRVKIDDWSEWPYGTRAYSYDGVPGPAGAHWKKPKRVARIM